MVIIDSKNWRKAMKPNILLITTDQQRFDTLGVYGNKEINTPFLNSIGSNGVVFKKNYVTCPICIPARRSLLTGLSPFEHGLSEYKEGLEFTPSFTVPQLLGANGYQTALVGKLHMFPQRKRFGFDHLVLSDTPNYRKNFKFQKENDYILWLQKQGLMHDSNASTLSSNGREARPFLIDEMYHHSSWVMESTLDYLENKRDPSNPWFLHMSFVAPHPPLNPPSHFWDLHKNITMKPSIGNWVKFNGDRPEYPELDCFSGPFSEYDMQVARTGYYGLISHIDSLLGSFFNRLFSSGSVAANEPTWVLFTSDHGEMLGDHHLWRKGFAYEGSTHVPLLIYGRKTNLKRGVCESVTCLEDVAATILELGEIKNSPTMYGKSLVPCLKDNQHKVREAVFGEFSNPYNYYFIVKGDFKYIYYHKSGEEQVFDLSIDPMEKTDVSSQNELLKEMRNEMLTHLVHQERSTSGFNFKPLKGAMPSALLSV